MRPLLLPRLVLLLPLLAASSVLAAGGALPRFLDDTRLDGIGLGIRVMRGATSVPMPSPKVLYGTLTQNGRSTKVERYDPRELWLCGEIAGRWSDAAGNQLVLASLTLPPPAFEERYVDRSDYDAWRTAQQGSARDWSVEQVEQWLQGFSGELPPRLPAPAVLPPKFTQLLAYAPARGQSLIFAFRLNAQAAGLHKAASRGWHVISFRWTAQADLKEARTCFEREVLAQVTACEPNAGAAMVGRRAEPSFPGAAKKAPAYPPEQAASRQAAIASVANLPDWWYAETPSYVLLSDLTGSQARLLLRQIQEDLETIRSAYSKLLPPVGKPTDVSVVRIMANEAAYLQYVGKEHEWSSGIWMPGKRELIIKNVSWGGRKDQREVMMRVIQHEALHQYLFYAFDRNETSAWFNEGHACFFEGARIVRGRIDVPEDEDHRLPALQKQIAAGASISTMLQMPYETFYGGSDENRQAHYAMAWGLVYFLRRGEAGSRQWAYGSVMSRYGEAIAAGAEPDAATAAAFEGIPTARLDADFLAFWKSRNWRAAAERQPLF